MNILGEFEFLISILVPQRYLLKRGLKREFNSQ